MQQNGFQGVGALWSMVKFRPPFPEDFIIKHIGKDYIEYFPGIIYKQPFSKITSVETRLVISKDDINIKKRYNLKEYESQMFYHNVVSRNEEYVFPLDSIVKNLKLTIK